jgi:hypothetical protein
MHAKILSSVFKTNKILSRELTSGHHANQYQFLVVVFVYLLTFGSVHVCVSRTSASLFGSPTSTQDDKRFCFSGLRQKLGLKAGSLLIASIIGHFKRFARFVRIVK